MQIDAECDRRDQFYVKSAKYMKDSSSSSFSSVISENSNKNSDKFLDMVYSIISKESDSI